MYNDVFISSKLGLYFYQFEFLLHVVWAFYVFVPRKSLHETFQTLQLVDTIEADGKQTGGIIYSSWLRAFFQRNLGSLLWKYSEASFIRKMHAPPIQNGKQVCKFSMKHQYDSPTNTRKEFLTTSIKNSKTKQPKHNQM